MNGPDRNVLSKWREDEGKIGMKLAKKQVGVFQKEKLALSLNKCKSGEAGKEEERKRKKEIGDGNNFEFSRLKDL